MSLVPRTWGKCCAPTAGVANRLSALHMLLVWLRFAPAVGIIFIKKIELVASVNDLGKN
jgi:hypothetical protein